MEKLRSVISFNGRINMHWLSSLKKIYIGIHWMTSSVNSFRLCSETVLTWPLLSRTASVLHSGDTIPLITDAFPLCTTLLLLLWIVWLAEMVPAAVRIGLTRVRLGVSGRLGFWFPGKFLVWCVRWIKRIYIVCKICKQWYQFFMSALTHNYRNKNLADLSF